MASTLQDRLYEIFAALASDQTRFPPRSSGALPETAANSEAGALIGKSILEQVRETVIQSVVSSSTTATGSPVGTSSVLSSVLSVVPAVGTVTDVAKEVSGGGSTAESIVTTVLKNAFGLAPLVSGLFGLFGGGETETPPPLVKYAMPSPIVFEAAEAGGRSIEGVDYDQTGRPRLYAARDAGASVASSPTAAPGAQITVNVNAMDARSFLDRSSDIAAAVREAMLNLNSINDVVNEL
jgi:hypothetical protein